MDGLNKSFQKGVVESETLNIMLEQCPEAANLLADKLGAAKTQLLDMATNGQITCNKLKEALGNKNLTLEEMKSAEYADKIAYTTVDGNIPYFWRTSQPNDFVTSGGKKDYTKGDSWLISNPILLNGSCDPDAGVAIKNISQSLEIYSHTYEETGTYTATFVANNVNYVHQGGQVVRELTINVVE